MVVSLTIVRYRSIAIPIGFMAMLLHRLPFLFNKKCSFHKLLGCGADGSVDKAPNFKHWGLLAVWNNETAYDHFRKTSFIPKWWKAFAAEEWTVICEPIASHGKWDKQEPFKGHKSHDKPEGVVGVITRASIRLNSLKSFRANIGRAARAMEKAPGFLAAVGIGEIPFFRQATFSLWRDTESMKNYAYKTFDHADVIKLTREQKWYSEELFARFRILAHSGTLNGKNPMADLSEDLHSNNQQQAGT